MKSCFKPGKRAGLCQLRIVGFVTNESIIDFPQERFCFSYFGILLYCTLYRILLVVNCHNHSLLPLLFLYSTNKEHISFLTELQESPGKVNSAKLTGYIYPKLICGFSLYPTFLIRFLPYSSSKMQCNEQGRGRELNLKVNYF